MAINFARTSYEGRTPAIWRGECKVLPGGFKPKNTLTKGMVILRGAPLCVDFDNMEAAVIKIVKVLAGGTTTKPRVAKGHYFAAGDVVMKVGKTDASPSVSSIDTSNSEYDVLTLSSAITGLTTDDVLVEATPYAAAVGSGDATPAAEKYVPNAVVASDLEVKDKLDTLDAAYEAVVLKNVLPCPLQAGWLEGIALKNNPNIIFIKQ
ncbi:MAG: hypothetical protein IJQ79_10385 [Bacteroidales bacterium]|nr:hypothetical protein [Bacteroidales bacterium]